MDIRDVEWQPISALPQIVAVMDGLLEEIQEFHATLGEARGKPHVMDDDTLDQVDRQYQERVEFLDLFAEQLGRWQALDLTAGQRTEIEALTGEVQAARTAVDGVLALSAELREGTIERVMELGDMETLADDDAGDDSGAVQGAEKTHLRAVQSPSAPLGRPVMPMR